MTILALLVIVLVLIEIGGITTSLLRKLAPLLVAPLVWKLTSLTSLLGKLA